MLKSIYSQKLGENALTLGISLVAMALGVQLGLPAPFITGPSIALAIIGLATNLRLGISPFLRNFGFVIIGLTIGSVATPDLIQAARAWPVSMVAMAATLAAIMGLGTAILTRTYAFSRRDALLACTPGHLSFVLSLAADSRDLTRITLVQSVRLLVLTLAVPFSLKLMGLMPPGIGLADGAEMSWPSLIVSFIVATGLGLALLKLRVPAALLLAGMVFSMVTHATGLVSGQPPRWLSIIGFTLLGALIGSRFSQVKMRELWRALGAGLLLTGVSFGLMFIAVLLVRPFVDSSLVTLLIAFAPGGLETMAAMAIIMDADVTFVAAHHLGRMLALPLLVTAFLAGQRLAKGKEPRSKLS